MVMVAKSHYVSPSLIQIPPLLVTASRCPLSPLSSLPPSSPLHPSPPLPATNIVQFLVISTQPLAGVGYKRGPVHTYFCVCKKLSDLWYKLYGVQNSTSLFSKIELIHRKILLQIQLYKKVYFMNERIIVLVTSRYFLLLSKAVEC